VRNEFNKLLADEAFSSRARVSFDPPDQINSRSDGGSVSVPCPSSLFFGEFKRSGDGQAQDLGISGRTPTVAHLFSESAAANPKAIALRAGTECMSYGELNAKANRLATYLRAQGAGPERVIGICLPRSFDQIVASLAVLKSGAAYLPLDPNWPEARLRELLQDADASLVITVGAAADTLATAVTTIALDRITHLVSNLDTLDNPAVVQHENLAYVIYTSGSTGKPKGVEVTHGNLHNLIFWHRRAFGVAAADRASHLAGLGFDASVWEIWPYLTAGASVTLVEEIVRTSSTQLREWIIKEKITIAFVPTALAEPLMKAEWPADTALRFLLTGAETLHTFPRGDLPFVVVNNYGPTECAVVATSGIVPAQSDSTMWPTIGRAISNTQIYLLDEEGVAVARGETGEIYIGGTSIGRGYRNDAELTAERFLPDRFSARPGARMYRTGDLARQLPDGQIEFHGRVDDQEKIRGHRIEPDEISTRLKLHPGIASSTVVARSFKGEKRLVGYVVPIDQGITVDELREFLAQALPDYMIPAAFVRLDLPLTSSGKVDKNALPAPAAENALASMRYRAPETAAEGRLAKIVAEVLDIERVGLDDNFFMMGGHSLLGTQVVLRAREAFGVELTLRHLFQAQTIGNLAVSIERLIIEKLGQLSEEEARRQVSDLESSGAQSS
jgi:amino acid adenylation domain-containing protein